jgi:hypothetical protein
MLFGLVILSGIVLGMMLIAFDDGIPFGLINKTKCKLGWHKNKINKIPKYYCQHCRKPRKYPNLKVIHGGNKMYNNPFKF